MNNQYYTYSRLELSPLIPNSYSNVLEIGCGGGAFRKNLKEKHIYWGVEPNEQAAETAKQQLDHVISGTFDQAITQLPDDHFDLIICNDVIEHLPDTDQFFTQIKPKMTSSAVIIGSVPNIRYLGQLYELIWHKDWQYKEAGILDKTHLRFYTEKSWRATLSNNALSVETLYGINGPQPKRFIRKLIMGLFVALFGQDTRHPQFAFKVIKTPE